jgi:hypothetical protein
VIQGKVIVKEKIVKSVPEVKKKVFHMVAVNISGKAGVQILHLPLGDDSSPSGDSVVSR